MCLVCGELVCCAGFCCRRGRHGECAQHAAVCGAGVGREECPRPSGVYIIKVTSPHMVIWCGVNELTTWMLV